MISLVNGLPCRFRVFCTVYKDLKDPAYQNEISQKDLIHFKYGQVNESTLTPC